MSVSGFLIGREIENTRRWQLARHGLHNVRASRASRDDDRVAPKQACQNTGQSEDEKRHSSKRRTNWRDGGLVKLRDEARREGHGGWKATATGRGFGLDPAGRVETTPMTSEQASELAISRGSGADPTNPNLLNLQDASR